MSSRETGGEPDGRLPTAADLFDAAWEARTRRSMEPTGWDAELAIRAARDALRVLSGELPEEEFRARHHAAYLREFGVDLRPTEPSEDSPDVPAAALEADALAGAGVAPDTAARSGRTAVSRRAALGMAGGGIAALMLGDLLSSRTQSAMAEGQTHAGGHAGSGEGTAASGGAATTQSDGTHKVQMGMVLDLDLCDGCLMCVSACKKAYGLPDGVHWLYVLAYKEPERPDTTSLLVRPCQHCSNAPCVKVCPTGARHRRKEDGLVLTDYEVCFGCRYCQVACPYGVNYFGWSDPEKAGGGFTGERKDGRGKTVIGAPPKGVMGKCIYCPGRQDSPHSHATTHCSISCPMGVIHYGDLNDPNSEPMQYLKKRMDDSGGKLSTFRLLENLGTRPNVIYIGHQPSVKAEPTEGPTKYEDWGFVNERRIVLEGPEPWFKRVFGGD